MYNTSPFGASFQSFLAGDLLILIVELGFFFFIFVITDVIDGQLEEFEFDRAISRDLTDLVIAFAEIVVLN
jgi:hypothetical protein